MDLNGLQLEVDGVTRTFAEWTKDFVDSYYPNVGVDCYRVPAQHFNRQELTKSAGGSSGELELLNPPIPCIAAGDLAHTLVLDNLEELSQQLRRQKEGPLFIISSVHYDNYLAKLQHTRSKRRKRKKNKARDSGGDLLTSPSKLMHQECGGEDFAPPSKNCEGEAESEGQGKQLLPPRPRDRGGQRGEIDVLLLHERCGVILVEVKSTGFPQANWTPSEEELLSAIARSVEKAMEQLDSSRDVLSYIMPDLSFSPVTLVVALPFLRRQQVVQALSGRSLDPRLRFLCKEDLQALDLDQSLPASRGTGEGNGGGSCAGQDGGGVSGFLTWWQSNVSSADAAAQGIALDTMRTIVGRICGLMSVVSVWSNSRPRIEVRTVAQAIGEAGRRISDIVLLPRQADLLAQSPQHVWLTGPMGSGKTIMLQLKGRQWVKEGRRVVVLNVRTTARGRPIAHVLEEGICHGAKDHPGAGWVDRYDIALHEYTVDALHKELQERGSMERICFLVDELLSDMSVIAEQLAQRCPDSPVWCVASYVTPVPRGFQVYRLGAVLRNPPSVQLMLKELDLNPRNKYVYTTRSAARGLPCDGPPIIFIEHSKHDSSVRHLDCLQCAYELADIFETQLGLELHPATVPESADSVHTKTLEFPPNSASGSKTERRRKTAQATSLTFRDVLILSSLPYSTYKHVTDYHWEPFIPEVLQYMIYMGKCRFLTGLHQRGVPFRVVADNTLKEIAFPPNNEVIISDVMGAHSLERKVVVFLRGGPPLTQEEISEMLSRYHTVQAAASAVHPDPQKLAHTADSQQQAEESGQESETMSKDMLLFASLMYEVRDLMCPPLPPNVSPSPEHARTIVHSLLGNMLVRGTRSFVEGKKQRETPQKEPQSGPHALPIQLRVGMEIRGNLPVLCTASQTHPEEESGALQTETKDSGTVIEADSEFLVPDLEEDAVTRQSEVNRIQRALAALSEDDQDWEFFAASRCLSQYISILP